jgi:hypothetical protein
MDKPTISHGQNCPTRQGQGAVPTVMGPIDVLVYRDWGASTGQRGARRGSSASRRVSPSTLPATSMLTKVRPGRTVTHQMPAKNQVVAGADQGAEGRLLTGRPSPRKDSAASAMMAPATWVVATTISGERILGRMCRRRIVPSLAPRVRAARTWSLADSTKDGLAHDLAQRVAERPFTAKAITVIASMTRTAWAARFPMKAKDAPRRLHRIT